MTRALFLFPAVIALAFGTGFLTHHPVSTSAATAFGVAREAGVGGGVARTLEPPRHDDPPAEPMCLLTVGRHERAVFPVAVQTCGRECPPISAFNVFSLTGAGSIQNWVLRAALAVGDFQRRV